MSVNNRAGGPPSPSVIAAQARRLARANIEVVRIHSFIRDVLDRTRVSVKNRMRICVEYSKSKVIVNISRPVTKAYTLSVRTGGMRTIVSDRSLPGEFPKADATLLMKTMIGTTEEFPSGWIYGTVGTPLDYGVMLEYSMDRSFLRRTLWEEEATLRRIMAGPI